MQETVRRILEGNFDYEDASLDFSCTKIEITLPKGGVQEGSFHIFSAPDRYVRGMVTSSDLRMQCLTAEFTGNDAEIFYRLRGEDMEEGYVLKGTFFIVSNQGEYELPFSVSVESELLYSSQGPIESLQDFAALARENWREAVKLFYSPEFVRIFQGADAPFYEVYRGMSACPQREQNMDEFLVAAGRKQPLKFVVTEEQILVEIPFGEHPWGITEAEIVILRNGWGCTALEVSCQGDFLFVEKDVLTDDDFLGNRCRLPLYIDSSLCRQGKNFGAVRLNSSQGCLEIPVTVRLGEAMAGTGFERERKRATVQLMELYQAFRLRKTGTESWLKETGRLVERLVARDENDVEARLFQAQLLITGGRESEAGWILDHAGELLEQSGQYDTALWAYYLYLTTLLPHEESYGKEIASEVEMIYRKNRREWRVAWLLLYLSEEYSRSDSVKWAFLQKQFQYGCRSPILYLEALLLLNNNPSLLRKLEGSTLQVLYYGVRQERLGEELKEQLLYLAGKVREYSSVLERLLVRLYQGQGEERILRELCTLLIKGGRRGTSFFPWYEKGVEAQLRITNLYEYYMLSLDIRAQRELPRMVLMYFLYQSNLDYERMAYLYHYVLRHREEHRDLYDSYRPKIERFVLERIGREQINPSLAGLYREVLRADLVNGQTADALAKLLFAHQVTVEQGSLHRVWVYQPGNLSPVQYVLQNGSAWIALYGDDNVIIFEDGQGNRLLKSVEYTLEKLMDEEAWLSLLEIYAKDSPQLDIYLAGRESKRGELSPEAVDRYQRMISSQTIAVSLRRKSYMRLLEHFSALGEDAELDTLFQQIPMEELSWKERRKVLRFMVARERYREAYGQVQRYLPYFAEEKSLLRLVEEMIHQKDFEADELLVEAAIHLFRKGKYSDPLLEYLGRYFQGKTGELYAIWKAGRSLGKDSPRLCQRILVQMLFTGECADHRDEVFRAYLARESGTEIQELTAAVLAQYSHEYFARNRLVESFVFEEIHHFYQRTGQAERVGKLAFLKYYADCHEQLKADMLPTAEDFLGELLEQRIHLNFFRKYKEFDRMLEEFRDRTILEYCSSSGRRPRIRYRLLPGSGEEASLYMRQVYPGLYFEEFVLFFGESIEYVILEEDSRGERPVLQGVLQREDSGESQENGGKYSLINEMLVSRSLGDYGELDGQLREYYRREFLGEKLFVLRTECER